ncbi:MAG TPA: xanthine dehydrogenase family protein molybdopterin-binding subunit [Acidimicrobiia bacterium]|jgi:carbon-monoxide dehydrogenase large subunit
MQAPAQRFVGHRVARVEDPRLLTGRGSYVDDVTVPGMLHAHFVRSPFAHASIRGIDVDDARRYPGVVAVYTGTDMEALTHPFMGFLPLPDLYHPMFFALAVDRVRLVGDPVALIVAESRYVAEDAGQLVVVDYEELQPIATIAHALDSTRPAIWPGPHGNVLQRDRRDYGDVDAVFAGADRVLRETFVQHRYSNQPMETRGCVAEVDPVVGTVEYHSATQNSHLMKWSLAALTGRQPVWQSVLDIARQRERMAGLLQKAKGMAASNKAAAVEKAEAEHHVPPKHVHLVDEPIGEGLASPASPGKSMAQTFLREPVRIVHLTRMLLGLLARDPITLPRVTAQDIGGAFGVKVLPTREDVAVLAAAVDLGRSVKWIEDRNEHLLVAGQAREETLEVEAALTDAGTLLGLRVHMTMDQGAYPAFPFSAAMYPMLIRTMMPGPYRLTALGFTTTITASNKATYVAYRGPWAVETWVRERMLDIAARDLGIGRDEIRLRNIIGPDELPRKMLTGPTLDIRMSARTTLERALEVADLASWPARQEAARAEGRCVGLGFATFIEAAPGPPDFQESVMPGGGGGLLAGEPARSVLEADGTVSVYTQQMPHGQGHETTLAQVAADALGVPLEQVRVRYGDTSITPFGLSGTGGSRSAPMAGGAVTYSARALRDQVLDVAADLLEAPREDLVVDDGNVHVAGVPSISVTFADVAAARPDEQLRSEFSFDGAEGGWAQATHVCWVEVDLDTGRVHIDRYVAVEDCGELINPNVVDGQVSGGVVQGIGAVLYERSYYDDQGNFQAGTFMDYLLPTACEVPEIEIHHVETPTDIEIKYRGVGEGGMIVAPAALTNAIEDALAHLGVRITEQHLPPARILELAGVIAPDA